MRLPLVEHFRQISSNNDQRFFPIHRSPVFPAPSLPSEWPSPDIRDVYHHEELITRPRNLQVGLNGVPCAIFRLNNPTNVRGRLQPRSVLQVSVQIPTEGDAGKNRAVNCQDVCCAQCVHSEAKRAERLSPL